MHIQLKLVPRLSPLEFLQSIVAIQRRTDYRVLRQQAFLLNATLLMPYCDYFWGLELEQEQGEVSEEFIERVLLMYRLVSFRGPNVACQPIDNGPCPSTPVGPRYTNLLELEVWVLSFTASVLAPWRAVFRSRLDTADIRCRQADTFTPQTYLHASKRERILKRLASTVWVAMHCTVTSYKLGQPPALNEPQQ